MRTNDLQGTLLAAIFLAAAPLAHPDAPAIRWNPRGISSPQWESHPAFDPVTGEFYFVRSSPAFEGWKIFVSRCTAAGWSDPVAPGFASDAVEADPYFTPDGLGFYFISTRGFPGKAGDDLDIWHMTREPGGPWGAPVRLPEPVNSGATEWFPRLAPDGWLYFGSKRAGGLGGNDIWRARRDAAGRWAAENLGPAVNTAADEFEPLLSADGSRMIVATGDGFYESVLRTPDGWSARRKLGDAVNLNGTEIGPLFSPSGRSLLFSRDSNGPESGEFYVWHEGPVEAWPPACPPR
jgi:hypothetical protein